MIGVAPTHRPKPSGKPAVAWHCPGAQARSVPLVLQIFSQVCELFEQK